MLATPVPVSNQAFRQAMGHFPTGVALITATLASQDVGMAANSLTSVSLEPPMLLVCLNRRSLTHRAVTSSGRFGVSVLAAQHAGLARRFALPHAEGDKFVGLPFSRGELGALLLDDAIARFECRLDDEIRVATHGVLLAEVTNAAAAGGDPLSFFRGAFGRLERAGWGERFEFELGW